MTQSVMVPPYDTGRLTTLSTELAISSPFFFGYDIAGRFSGKLDEFLIDPPADKIFIVADNTVYKLHSELGRSLLEGRGNAETVLVKPGEAAKSWEGLTSLCERLMASGASKRSVIVAFGGGSVGNLAGLAASLLFRGIRYVEVPTSFQHLTDGCLSNKQAINGRLGKNHFGVFYAPIFVWADARYLGSEPERSLKAGIAEAIKNGLISQPGFINYLRGRIRPDCRYTAAELGDLALNTVRSKLETIRKDPSEKHYALVLEYGHTFGHAIESLGRGALLHGECVAVGMKMAAHLANEQGLISKQVVNLHYELTDSCLGLTPGLPPSVDAQSMFATMKHDNKRTGDSLRFVLLNGLGSCAHEGDEPLVTISDNDYIVNFLERYLDTYRARGPSSVPQRGRRSVTAIRTKGTSLRDIRFQPELPARIPLEETVNPRFPDLDGKHVLITGGANGIGAAVAIAFAGQGCEVTLLDKDLKAGERVVGACRALGAKACLREVDLVDSRMLCDVLDHVKREQPTVDVLVLNAGYDPRFTDLEMTEQQWSDLFQLNVTHYFLTCRELVPAMVAGGGGGIIMTASHTVWLAKPDLIAYNSTKAAVVGFMRSLAEAVGRDRIRVNAVAPGWTMTDRQLRQWVTEEAKYRTIHELQLLPLEIRPEDLTGTYLFLASDSSAPITRQVLAADAGQSRH